MKLYSPLALLLLLLLPVLAYLMVRKKGTAAVRFPSLGELRNCPASWRLRFRPVLVAARLVCLGLLIVALARPREETVLSEVSTEGVAIEAVVDHSGSMQTEMDYYGDKQNRLDVVKKVLAAFISGDNKAFAGRASDLIGLVTFARYADTTCPLVLGHDVLLEFLDETEIVRLRSEDGTAIGDAIALAAARLKKAEEEMERRKVQMGLAAGSGSEGEREPSFEIKSKAIILLTDGRHNAGRYRPLEAAELAKEWGIKIYTIGIGSAQAYTTIETMMGSFKIPTHQELDETLLTAIAEKTGGVYGRADDAEALRQIVRRIDELEKTEVKTYQYAQYSEDFWPWALGGLLVLVSEMLAGCTIFRKVP